MPRNNARLVPMASLEYNRIHSVLHLNMTAITSVNVEQLIKKVVLYCANT